MFLMVEATCCCMGRADTGNLRLWAKSFPIFALKAAYVQNSI